MSILEEVSIRLDMPQVLLGMMKITFIDGSGFGGGRKPSVDGGLTGWSLP